MKKVGRALLSVVIAIWFVIAVFVTACLLSYNDFKVSVFGKYSLVIIDSDEMEPDYKEGDLLIVKRASDSKLKDGEKIFYYNTSKDSDVTIYTDYIKEKKGVTKNETTFVLNDTKVSGEYVLGSVETAKTYHNLGFVLGVLTSKWGYMFLVIFPTLFATIYEIIMIVDLAKDKDKEKEE